MFTEMFTIYLLLLEKHQTQSKSLVKCFIVLFSSAEAKPELLFCSLWRNQAGPDFLYYIPSYQLGLTRNSSLIASAWSVDQQYIRASPCSRSPQYWSLPRPFFIYLCRGYSYLAELELCCSWQHRKRCFSDSLPSAARDRQELMHRHQCS